jgi:hypothetical protein
MRSSTTPAASAALRTSSAIPITAALPGKVSVTVRARPGTRSRSNSTHLPCIPGATLLIAVRLPPGLARLATSPVSTGLNAAPEKTMGIVLVDRFTACAATVLPSTTIISTWSRTSSVAISANWLSVLSVEKRRSMAMLRPST